MFVKFTYNVVLVIVSLINFLCSTSISGQNTYFPILECIIYLAGLFGTHGIQQGTYLDVSFFSVDFRRDAKFVEICKSLFPLIGFVAEFRWWVETCHCFFILPTSCLCLSSTDYNRLLLMYYALKEKHDGDLELY